MVIDLVEVTYPRPGTCVIALHGEHDRLTADRMERRLREALALNDLVVVDVGDADFIDSSFVHNLLVADRHAREQGKVFRLQMGTALIVRRALEASGVLQRLNVVPSRAEALELPADPDRAPV
jgi:anti-anti-sigma factor